MNPNLLIHLAISLWGAAVYLNALPNGFVYDDFDTVAHNQWLAKGGDPGVLLDHRYFLMTGEYSYRPLPTLTVMLDYQMYGLKPLGYHLTNLLIHLLVCNIVIIFVRTLTDSWFIAGLTGLFQAIHPALSEAVNGISYREDLFVTGLVVASLLLTQKTITEQGVLTTIGFGAAACACTLAACLSKENAVVQPILAASMLVLAPKFKNLGVSKRLGVWARILIPSVIALALYSPIRFVLMKNPAAPVYSYTGGSLGSALLSSLAIIASYFRILLIPYHLSADHVVPAPKNLADAQVLFGLALVCGIFYLVYRSFKSNTIYGYGFFWFLVALLPVSNLIPIANPMAERYLYLPMVGFMIGVGDVIGIYGYRAPKFPNFRRELVQMPVLFILFIAGIFSIKTATRNPIWKDPLTLWRVTVKDSPQAPRANMNLGSTLFKSGRYQESLPYLHRAVELKQDYEEAYYDLGVVYYALADYPKAESYLLKAIALKPTFEEAHSNLGSVYNTIGKHDAAIARFRKALELRPDKDFNYYNLSVALSATNNFTEAESLCRQALDLNPQFKEARDHLGKLFTQLGRYQDAERTYRDVLTLYPHEAQTRNRLGLLYWQQKRYPEALTEFEQTVVDDPVFVGGILNLAVTLFEVGRYQEAQDLLTRTRKAHPDITQMTEPFQEVMSAHAAYLQNPTDSTRVIRLAQAFKAHDRPDRALEVLQQYLQAGGENPTVQQLLTKYNWDIN